MPSPIIPAIPPFAQGQPIDFARFEQMRQLLNQLRLSVVSPLEISFTPGGTILRVDIEPFARFAVTTSRITAMSGETLGSGTISLRRRTDTGLLVTLGLADTTVWNSTGSTIAEGQIVQVKWIDHGWAVDVADCAGGT